MNTAPVSNRPFTRVSVKAKVVAVQRSKQGIKPDTEILIQYESQKPTTYLTGPWVGPRRIEILQQGRYYPAFLNIADDRKSYDPAAYGESFNMTPERSY